MHTNDVDTAHLLGNHDGEGGQGSSADTRNGEELDESCRVVGLADDGGLNLQLCIDVIQITAKKVSRCTR